MRRASLRTPSTGSRPSRSSCRRHPRALPYTRCMAKMEERQELWGAETTKAIAKLPVSGEPIPAPVARWLGPDQGRWQQHAPTRISACSTRDKADRIAAAAERIAARRARRPVSDRRLPDRLRHLIEHERERGPRQARRRRRPRERRRQHGTVVERRLPLRRPSRCARRDRPTTFSPRWSSLRTRSKRRRWSSTTSWKSGPRHGWTPCRSPLARNSPATPRRCARASSESARPHRGSARSRSAERPSEPGSTPIPSSPRALQLLGRDRPRVLAAGRPVRGSGCTRRHRRGLGRAEDSRRVADECCERYPLPRLGPAGRPRRDCAARAPEGQLDHARQGEPGHAEA